MTHPHDNPVRAELQSLDQRRADTLADALRPDAAPTGDVATMRRVVTAGDVVHEIAVEPTGQHITVRGEGMSAIYDVDPARAVLYFAALRSWDVKEIRGPGEATAAEQLAAITARAEAAEQERDAARAIVEGRTLPPTDAEMAQHDSRGGSWLIAPRHYQPVAYRDISIARHYALMALDGDDALAMTWWALDATGRPCAWPVVDGGPHG